MLKGRAGIFMAEHRARIVMPYMSGHLLDIGCGPNRLVRMYGNGVGADVRQWGDVDVLLDGYLPFDAEEFDTVTILAALSHIESREAMLKEARRVLRPGGMLIITMIPLWFGRLLHFMVRPVDVEQGKGLAEGELPGMSNADVRQMLETAGFEIELEKRIMVFSRLTIARGRK